MTPQTKQVQLSSGTIRYRESGDGPPIVFVPGLFIGGTMWRKVIPELEDRYRCIAPDWPLGAHSVPMKESADQTPRGVARLIGELLDALDLDDVTLVGNDTGTALCQMLAAEGHSRIGRLVLTPGDAFDIFPPRLFRPLLMAAKVPGVLMANLSLLRIRPLRRLPIAFGWLAKRPIPNDVTDGWLQGFFAERGVRRDTARFLRGIDPAELEATAERLRGFDKPVLLAWAPEDRFFPLAHARRLAELLPDGRVEEIPDSWTYVAEDQPERTAALIREFVPWRGFADEDAARREPTTTN